MKVPFSSPDISDVEIAAVTEVLRSCWITTGERVNALEASLAEYLHTEKTICLNSATACMESVLRILEVGPGDEVITSAYTYTASASVVCHLGAKLVLVDTAPDSYEMDADKLAAAITSRTKVIIPVDLGGVVCNYDSVFSIVEAKRNLFQANSALQKAFGRIVVLADAAHAMGATWHGLRCGEIADFTSFSFHAVKNMTTAEGGALTWKNNPALDDEWLYRQIRLWTMHGQTKDAMSKDLHASWEYDIALPGYKYNMTDIVAAIGLSQLKRYPEMQLRRRRIIDRYNAALKDNAAFSLLKHNGEGFVSSGHLYMVRLIGKKVNERNKLIEEMAEYGIACNVHYKPLPMMTAYQNLGFDIKDYPNAYSQYENEITLPLYTKLTDDQVEYVISTFLNLTK